MKTEQMRELDAWIAENVFKYPSWNVFSPTSDPAASDALDDKILEKSGYRVNFTGAFFLMQTNDGKHTTSHADKKICRVLFAKKLFEKGNHENTK